MLQFFCLYAIWKMVVVWEMVRKCSGSFANTSSADSANGHTLSGWPGFPHLRESAEHPWMNSEGQYAPYTFLAFSRQIEEARAVASDEASEYYAEKEAYEQLRENIKDFRNAADRDVISAEEAERMAEEESEKTCAVDFRKDTELSYVIEGANLKKPVTMNLTAREKGPYYSEISETLAELSLRDRWFP